MQRLQERYREEIVPTLMKEFGYQNVMQVPRIRKIVINIGLGEALDNPRALEYATNDLRTITGQQPVVTRARKSIANFKLREGRAIGVKVTLRGTRMWAFLDRLINVALPGTIPWAFVSNCSFLRLITIASTRSGVWKSRSIQRLRRMGKPDGCWSCWACPSDVNVASESTMGLTSKGMDKE